MREPISVVLSAYNAERWLAAAIQSVLVQTHADFELILVDDGSNDGTSTIMSRFADQDRRIRLITHENWGMAESLNHAIRLARYPWIARMDADDLMMPNRLERQLSFVSQHPNIAVASSLVEYIDADDRAIGQSTSELSTERDFRGAVRRGDVIAFNHPGVLMRAASVLSAGGYRREFSPVEDLDLWNRLAANGELLLVQPEILLRYRIHSGSMWSSATAAQAAKILWLQACIQQRSLGLPEPSWCQFQAQEAESNWFEKFNRQRTQRSLLLYRDARSAFAHRRYPAMSIMLAASLLMRPSYSARQVWTKFVAPKFGIGL